MPQKYFGSESFVSTLISQGIPRRPKLKQNWANGTYHFSIRKWLWFENNAQVFCTENCNLFWEKVIN
jgi:hypothetical protein